LWILVCCNWDIIFRIIDFEDVKLKLKQSLLNILISSKTDESDNSIEYGDDSELELEQVEYESCSENSKEESEENYCLGPDLCTV